MAVTNDIQRLGAEAARAWGRVGVGDVTHTDLILAGRKSTVCRLQLDGGHVRTVVAKRSSLTSLSVERAVYEDVLPRVGVTGAGFLGYVPEADTDSAWLFLEYVTGSEPDAPRWRIHAAEWLANMHYRSLGLTDLPALPDRGDDYFLGRLRQARRQLEHRLRSLRNDTGRERGACEYAAQICDDVEKRWEEVVSLVEALPRVFVHGDFSPPNLRLHRCDGCTTMIALDWGSAGWGPPAVDLFWADADAYITAAQRRLCGSLAVGPSVVRHCSELLRVLSHDWSAKPPGKVFGYASRLSEAVCGLGASKSTLGTTRGYQGRPTTAITRSRLSGTHHD
jgi:hypothetical protein